MSSVLKSLKSTQLLVPLSSNEILRDSSPYIDFNTKKVEVKKLKNHYVDLQKVRDSGHYLQLLSSNTRQQIKRSFRQYNQAGQIRTQLATDKESALAFFKSLVDLHQKQWQKRGRKGAFSNKFTINFHQKLIADCYDTKTIRIYKISTEYSVIGYIYGFISTRDFTYYQSGFASANNKLKPGLCSHASLIELLANEGIRRYDFLAGDSQYKRSLSTDHYLAISSRYYAPSIAGYTQYLKQRLKSLIKQLIVKMK